MAKRRNHAHDDTPTIPALSRLQKLNEAITGQRTRHSVAAAATGLQLRHARRRQLSRSLIIAFAMLAFTATGLLAANGYVSRQPIFDVDLDTITQADANLEWADGRARELIDEHLQASLRRTLREQLDPQAFAAGQPVSARVSLLRPGLAQLVHDAFDASPWVREVHAVRVQYPRTLHVSFTLARPRLAALCDRGFLLLDGETRVLPLAFASGTTFKEFNAGMTPPLRTLVGCPPPPAEAGGKWADAPIVAGLAVNAEVDAFAALLAVESIDVSNVGGALDPARSEITLTARAADGHLVTLLWGRAPGEALYGENTVEQKLAHLRGFIDKRPDLAGISEIDLRFPAPEWQPLIGGGNR
ncbi:MAG: hypothetical protein AB7K09_09065 [Planctomycetota bacterium]